MASILRIFSIFTTSAPTVASDVAVGAGQAHTLNMAGATAGQTVTLAGQNVYPGMVAAVIVTGAVAQTVTIRNAALATVDTIPVSLNGGRMYVFDGTTWSKIAGA